MVKFRKKFGKRKRSFKRKRSKSRKRSFSRKRTGKTFKKKVKKVIVSMAEHKRVVITNNLGLIMFTNMSTLSPSVDG